MQPLRSLGPILALLGIWGAAVPGGPVHAPSHGPSRRLDAGYGAHHYLEGLLKYELTLIDRVVFEAPEHDYPQIVGYRRSGPDSVTAWIDGRQGGKRQRIEFPYRRVACGPKRAG
jgi:hypothetical protein